MLKLQSQFQRSDAPFVLHIAQDLLTPAQVRTLYQSMPLRQKRIERTDLNYEKQYAMNLMYLVEDDERNPEAMLTTEWRELLGDLQSDSFMSWLEAGTGLQLRTLTADIGLYTHRDGDYISVHTDKQNKAITAVLYLNEQWPDDAGGCFEVRASPKATDPPVRLIRPRAGQLLAFPPSPQSWHAVSPVRTGGDLVRLTVQLEFWYEKKRSSERSTQ